MDPKMTSNFSDSDLSWTLKSFNQPKKAGLFFDRFNEAFSVYSAAVGKIYTDYKAEVVMGSEPLLVIQPNMYEFSSMFHNVSSNAVKRTSVVLFEDSGVQKLSGVMASTEVRKSFDIHEGLFRLFSGEFIDGAFLPLVTSGDLRSLPDLTQPILQLHGLKVEELLNLSEFQITDIVDSIKSKIVSKLAA